MSYPSSFLFAIWTNVKGFRFLIWFNAHFFHHASKIAMLLKLKKQFLHHFTNLAKQKQCYMLSYRNKWFRPPLHYRVRWTNSDRLYIKQQYLLLNRLPSKVHLLQSRHQFPPPFVHFCFIVFLFFIFYMFFIAAVLYNFMQLFISTQVFLGFSVPRNKCCDGSQDSKLPLHASHVALPSKI